MKMKYKDMEFEIDKLSDIDLIRELISEGRPEQQVPVIPEIKLRKVKSGSRNHKQWSAQEDAYLLANLKMKSGELSKRLGRKRSAIKRRKKYLLLKKPKMVEKRGGGRKKFEMNDFHKKTIAYLSEGKLQEDVAKLMGVSLRDIYNLSYKYRQLGLLKKFNYIKIKAQNNISSLDDASFAIVPANKMDAARDLIRGCIKSKCALTVKDCGTYLGLSQSEALAFLVDLFNQQQKLGYKVRLSTDKAVFE